MKALAELIAAAGLEHPRDLRPHHFMRRAAAADRVVTFAEIYRVLAPGELLSGTDSRFRDAWATAQAELCSRKHPSLT